MIYCLLDLFMAMFGKKPFKFPVFFFNYGFPMLVDCLVTALLFKLAPRHQNPLCIELCIELGFSLGRKIESYTLTKHVFIEGEES